MIAAPPVLLRAVIRVCTDPETAYIIDNVLNMLCVMYRGRPLADLLISCMCCVSCVVVLLGHRPSEGSGCCGHGQSS